MDIPWQQLSAEALQGILEEYASREGTEYGEQSYTLKEMVQALCLQLQRGEAGITFDAESGTCSLTRLV